MVQDRRLVPVASRGGRHHAHWIRTRKSSRKGLTSAFLELIVLCWKATVNASNRVVVSVGSITQQVDGPREIIDLMAQVDSNLAGRPGEAAWQLLEFVRDGQNYSSLHDVREHYWKWKQRQM